MASKRNVWLALFLGWLIPGLGHLYFKRHAHGAVYLVLICGLYGAGVALSRGTAVNLDIHGAYFACQLFAGPITLGLEVLRGHEAINLGETVGVLEHQSGVVYAATAGILNLVTLAELFRRQQEPDAPGPADTMRNPQSGESA